MKRLLLLLCVCLSLPLPAQALTLEDGADAPTRGIEDYIKDYVDTPKGALNWKQLGKTKIIDIETKDADGMDVQYFKPDFPAEVKSLAGQKITIKGFMFPLDETEDQKTFIFGPFPLNCPFQYHVQSNLVIEVHADNHPVAFTYDPVSLEGTLELVPEDKENGTFYRLNDARIVK
jgi:hypothetical protein